MTESEKLAEWLRKSARADIRHALVRGRAVAVVLALPQVSYKSPNDPIDVPTIYKVHARMVGDQLRAFWGDEDIGPVYP